MTSAVPIISDLESWSEMVNNRRETRTEFRTTGSIYPLADESDGLISSRIKVWTVDVSTSGALVRSFKKIPETIVYLELLMPELFGSVIEGELVRQETEVIRRLNGKEQTTYLHGVHFKKFVPRTALPESFATVSTDEASDPVEESSSQESSYSFQLDEEGRNKAITILEVGFILLVLAAFSAGLLMLN